MPTPTRRRPPAAGKRARAVEIVDRLARAMPDVRIALEFGNDLELLVSVILSAQSTDAGVNRATPALFARYRTAPDYAAAAPEELWPFIRSLGLYRNKAKAIVAAMAAIAAEHGGRVPRTREALEALPGVGRKTAGVVLVHLGAAHAFPVDTHVGRVARRLGLTRQADPSKVEQDLMALVPEERWGEAHQLFVWHGRRTCDARRPACSRCPVEELCPKRGVPVAMRR
ncbi:MULTISPECIES: endonuclease III [unclassified Anaeromyxobacter]|uniref:endonuclease III n=1 Tax=unclassified Anaeromyxobacter TaxID=2620896 RepID=UPI001F5A0E3B|nr:MULTISPECIES: endonuclease III [unclassified Anaeromyxobacter]